VGKQFYMSALGRLETRILRLNRWCIGVMLGVMFVLVFTNVITRYCLGFSIASAEEISTFLMIWVTYLGAVLALREGKLASIDALQDRLPPSLLRPVRVFLGLAMVAFFAALALYGVQFVSLGWSQETFALMIPRGIPYLVLPLGSVLFALHILLCFGRWVGRQWDRAQSPEEAGTLEGTKP